MKHAAIKARSLRGDVHLPGDKSISHRPFYCGMAQSESVLSGLLDSDDIRATKAALESLGVQFSEVGAGCTSLHLPLDSKGSAAPQFNAETPVQRCVYWRGYWLDKASRLR